VNPALGTELFLSNALGNAGALAFIADREYAAIGAGLRYTSGSQRNATAPPNGAPPMDPGAAASLVNQSFARALRPAIHAGNSGTFVSLGGAPVTDLALGTFLDYVSGTLDEGELGGLVAVRFVRQGLSTPVSLSVLASASRSNNVLVNLLAGRGDEFARRGLKKSGFRFGDESVADGKLYLLTGALTVRRDFANGGHAWGAPTLSTVQRRGVELVGVAGGVTFPFASALRATVESGVPAGRDGNALHAASRVRRIPWLASLAWTVPGTPISIDMYGSNRVGTSPFHVLRVRANGDVAVGVGVTATLWPR
jgi:hypothetical protein